MIYPVSQTYLELQMDSVIFSYAGDAWTGQAGEHCTLEFVIFKANVPLFLSNGHAVKVQSAAHRKQIARLKLLSQTEAKTERAGV